MADPLVLTDHWDTLRWSLERSKCERDFEYLARTYLRIKSKTQIGLPTLKFNAVQRYIHKTAEDQLKRTGYIRKLYGKARQMGSTVYWQGRTFHQTAFHDNRNALFVAHDDPASVEIFGVTKAYYDAMPIALKPRTKYDARQKIEFIGRNSKIISAHAANINVAAGQMYHIAHLTEAARYPNPEKVQASIFPSLSEARGEDHSIVVIESTSVFGGNWFKEMFEAARRGENEYEAHFIPWFWHDAYTLPIPHDFEMTFEEKEWKRQYGLSDGQIAWWHKIVRDYARNPAIVRAEYPHSWEASWVLPIGTLRVFTDRMLQDAARGVRPADYRALPTSAGLEKVLGGPVEVWEAPQPGVFYHFGCFPDGEQVWTEHGLSQIEDVRTDSQLLTASGTYEKPLNVQRRWYAGPLVGLTLMGSPTPVWVTPDHPIRVTTHRPNGRARVSCKDRRQIRLTTTEWRRAGDIVRGDVAEGVTQFGPELRDDEIVLHWHQDHVRVDRQINPRVLLDPEFWFVAGLWLAEGYARRGRLVDGCSCCTTSWSLNHTTDRDLRGRLHAAIPRLFGRKITTTHSERPADESLVHCQPLFDFFVSNFGTGSHEKRLPGWVLRLPAHLKLRLFEGYWRGDGCTAVVRNGWPFLDCVSVSHPLLNGMQALLASLSVVSCLKRLRHAGTTLFPNQTQPSQTRETWSLVIVGSATVDLLERLGYSTVRYRKARRAVCSTWFSENHSYTRVKQTQQKEFAGWVNNFETPSHTYVASRMIVHNCDLAEGSTDKADWSVGCVVRRDTLAQVAQFRVHENPASTDFLDLVYWLGMAYNSAEINPDITGGWGNALLTELQYRNYPNIWRWRRRDDAKQRISTRIGFLFTKRDKAHLVGNAVALATRGEVSVASETLLDEMRIYLNIGLDEWSAAPGQYDDAVTAWMLALLAARDERSSSGQALPPEEPVIAKDSAKWHNVDADLEDEETTALIRMEPWKG